MAGYGYAFKLSKQEVKDATPPGTSQLVDHGLERTTSGRETVHDSVLRIPQPSSDSADPLNFATWRKLTILFCVSLFAFISNFQSSGISSVLPVLIPAFLPPKTFSTLTHLIAVNVLMLGASNIWWVPLANVFGRRPIILISLLILCFCSMWGGLAKSFDSLLAARLFMGIGGGSAETIGPDIIGEIFFVHQRGRAMAFYTVMLAVGSLLGGLSGSYIAASHGWRWVQWTNVILAGGNFLLCLFFLPETLFDRAKAMQYGEVGSTNVTYEKDQTKTIEKVQRQSGHKPYTFARSLSIGVYRGRLAHQFVAPYRTLLFPGVWMVMLQYAGLVGGIVTISTIAPQLVSVPPYRWGANAGLVNVGGVVGTVLGAVFTYLIVDRSLTAQAKKETHGYGEPETRLQTQFPGLIMATFGLWIFGACAANPAPGRWVGLEFGLGMVCFGLMQAPSVGFNYIIEAYNAVSGDCFVMIVLFRAIISFAWTFFVGEWVQSSGAMEPFGIFGMLMAIFTLLTVPMYIWGKRTRIATAKWLPDKADH